jgi:hypothetical protein
MKISGDKAFPSFQTILNRKWMFYLCVIYYRICLKRNGKVFPMLNQVQCHKDVGGTGGIAPHILNLDNRWN